MDVSEAKLLGLEQGKKEQKENRFGTCDLESSSISSCNISIGNQGWVIQKKKLISFR